MKVLRVLPILPIVVPAVASVIGWAFLLSPRPGYLNALLRNLPWWDHLEEGPVDIYTMPWIVIITGFGLTAFVYLFVSSGFANINSELLEAAQVSGSRGLGVFFRITLPLLRPVLVYGGGVALLLGLGQFTGPLLLGRNAGITVLTTQMYFSTSQSPIDYGAAAAIGSPLLLFGVFVVIAPEGACSATRPASSPTAARRSEPTPSRRSSPIGAIVGYSFLATVLPVTALVIVSLSPFWSADIDVGRLHPRQLPGGLRDTSGITEAIRTSLVSSLAAVVIAVPIGFFAATLLLKGRKYKIMRPVVDFLVTMPLGHPGGGVRRRLPADLHPGAVLPLRHPVGDHPRLRHADAAVHDEDAAGRHGVARQHVPRGGPGQRCRRAAHERQHRPAAAAVDHRRRRRR